MQHDWVLDPLAQPEIPPPALLPMVLVVDDQLDVRQLVSRILRTRGFDVYVADSAAHAVQLANIIRFDAAVIDLAMPEETSGLNLLAWFRSHRSYRRLPVMILTGHLELDEDVQELIRRQHAYVFYKGHSLAVLVDHLTRLTRRDVMGAPPLCGLLPWGQGELVPM